MVAEILRVLDPILAFANASFSAIDDVVRLESFITAFVGLSHGAHADSDEFAAGSGFVVPETFSSVMNSSTGPMIASCSFGSYFSNHWPKYSWSFVFRL